MGHAYYKHGCQTIREEIAKRFPNTKPDAGGLDAENPSQAEIASYLLWVAREIEKLDPYCLESAIKAARWIGWIFRAMETDLKIWNNVKSRHLARLDTKDGNHLPIKPLKQ